MKIDPAFQSLCKKHSAVAASALLFVSLIRANTSGTTANNTPAAHAYIEPPQTTVVTTSSSYYSGGSYYGGYGGYSGGIGGNYRWPDYSSATIDYPRRYFFPPIPPPLGEAYAKSRAKSSSLVRSTIPLALSDYVNEPFYSPLSPLLYEEELSKRRQKTLDDYRTAKLALVTELRMKIESLAGADTAAREAQLAAFAREQTPRIIPIEAKAYEIRDQLTSWSWFSESTDWNEARQWRLGDDTRWESTLDEAKVMRGAAFFQDGLSPAQRRLLREYAMELDDSGRSPTADIALDGHGPYFYFGPETSRIRLPTRLPADLRAKIDAYVQQKAAIKKELRDVLYREDRRWSDHKRTTALRQLAAKQAPAIEALEPLAEDIRRGLAALPTVARPSLPSASLPPTLARQIVDFLAGKNALQQTLSERLASLKRQFPKSRVEFVKMGQGYGIQMVPNRKLNPQDASRFQAAVSDLQPFNEEQVGAYLKLVQQKAAIRDGLVTAAGPVATLVTPRIADLILREYASVLQDQELWNQFHDYEVAVLQPGLSPQQRRILYDAALVKLDLQLPFYTY